MTQRRYYYPFEVVKLGGQSFTKSFVLDLITHGTCCSCHKTLQNCSCASTEEENERVHQRVLKVFKARREFWEYYTGDYTDDQAILEYAEQMVESKRTKTTRK